MKTFPCRYPGCPAVVLAGRYYCGKHRGRQHEQTKDQAERDRPLANTALADAVRDLSDSIKQEFDQAFYAATHTRDKRGRFSPCRRAQRVVEELAARGFGSVKAAAS